jgi:uncharacterized membrane protein
LYEPASEKNEDKKERICMHWIPWGMGFSPLFPLLWIGIIVLLCVSLRRMFGWRGRHEHFYTHGGPPRPPFHTPFEPDAMEILRRRYARGEIDATTFDQMRERLEGSARPHE